MTQNELDSTEEILKEMTNPGSQGFGIINVKNGLYKTKFSKYNFPTVKEASGKDWYVFGTDNFYPQFLSDAFNRSSTHNSIINMKMRQVAGQGWTIPDSADKEQQSLLKKALRQHGVGETYNEVLRKCAFDLELYGAFSIGITWSRDFKSIPRIYHVDTSTIRLEKEDDDGEINGYYFSKDWKKVDKDKNKPKRIAKFDTTNRIDVNQLMYVKKYSPGTKYYGLPSYIGAMNTVQLQYELSNHLLNSIQRGFSPSIMLSLNEGMPTAEAKEDIFRLINSYYSGSDNAGKPLVLFAKDKNSAPIVTPLNVNSMDQLYKVLSEFCAEQIVQAHGLTSPELAGISMGSRLGNSDIARAQSLFYSNVINPDQILIEEAFNKILEVNGFSLEIFVKDVEPLAFQIEPDQLLKVLTLDETRERLGYDAASEKDILEIGSRNNWASAKEGQINKEPKPTKIN
jgi:hypothetical protein